MLILISTVLNVVKYKQRVNIFYCMRKIYEFLSKTLSIVL